MNNYIEVIVIVEGKTEEIFINSILKEYLSYKDIYMMPIQISKPGQKGGDVKFSRAVKDIGIHMKQRKDTYVGLFVDYYGLKQDWPGLNQANKKTEPFKIASIINNETHKAVNNELSEYSSDSRFIPYVNVHEFEALLFSDPVCLTSSLKINQSEIDNILKEFGDPEKIDNSPITAPSKRIEDLFPRYKKTSTGITVAKDIGIDRMRDKCKVFNNWINRLEKCKLDSSHLK